jgi:hypothetical protein
VDQEASHQLVDEISLGDLLRKPGWIRMSIHPTTTNEEIKFVCESIKLLAENHKNWALDYNYDKMTNEFIHKKAVSIEKEMVEDWFKI